MQPLILQQESVKIKAKKVQKSCVMKGQRVSTARGLQILCRLLEKHTVIYAIELHLTDLQKASVG